jgi:hypothetical protein
MNDPHVEALYYAVKHGDHVDYSKAAPLDHEELGFNIHIADERAQITMKRHFPSLAEARAAVEPFLRAWELDMGLRYGPRALNFEYEHGQVIDRKPTPGVHAIVAKPINMETTFYPATLTVGFTTFPPPPSGMSSNALVDLMYARYVLCRDGRTTLADAANYCLTCLVMDAGGRRGAASKFSVAKKVLDTLGQLCATRGGAAARKAAGAATDFTAPEAQWLEAAMTAVIRRASEVASDAGAARSQITMADLPPV